MALTEIEWRWLQHAWAVFHTPPDHLARCPGVQSDSNDPIDLDPGFVGPSYPTSGGGLLCGHPVFARSIGPDLAWRQEGMPVVAEVKTLPRELDTHQLRLGLGQVLEYRTAAQRSADVPVAAVLWVERAPIDGELWVETCRSAGVMLCWPGGPSPLDIEE